MWCVINVRPGCEERALQVIQEHAVSCGLQELFVPRTQVREWRGGEPREYAVPMIPGCVIAVAPSAREVRAALRRARGVDELLRGGARSFEALGEAEAVLLDRLVPAPSRVAAHSEAYLDGVRVVVTSGSLQGLEGAITKVDHHRKRAYVRLSVAGREVEATLGLRVVAKRESAA